jgi:phosphoglycerol transferase MdoB-like AlkP superfamily enzyme
VAPFSISDLRFFIFILAMGSKFKFLLLYFLSWIVFFDLLRLLFLLYHLDKTRELSFSTILNTFWYGLRMDMSLAAYILAPVCLFVLLSLIIPFFRRRIIYRIYTFLILFVILLTAVADLEIYNAWGFRIDATPLQFLQTPREVMASISHLPLAFIIVSFLVGYVLLLLLFKFVLDKIFFKPQPKLRIVTAVAILVFMGILIIPIRGGFQLAPLNQSSVYFSTNNYANHSAINASWNLMHSLFSKGVSGKNPYQYLPVQRQKEIIDSLYKGGDVTEQLVTFPAYSDSTGVSPTDTATNIIVVIWESFTDKAVPLLVGNKEVLPQFKRLRQEGIYFSNVYATGDRTNKGVPGILSGYPAMPNTTVIHSPGKSAKLKVLSQLFKQRGYATPFFYGGEPEFANIKSYILHGGFDPIVSKSDFSSKDMNSKWGAHDGVVMKRVLEDINRTKQPFFVTWLTLSSHEPFETPLPAVLQGTDMTSQFLNSLHYTDQVIGDFVDQCSKQPWWKHTLLIITGDHGHRLPATTSSADDFRIPMLWLGGALRQRGVAVNKIVSQIDIATTLSRQAGFKGNDFPFSKNIFDPAAKEWAFFNFNNGFGFVDSSGRVVFDNVGKRLISQQGQVGAAEIEAGKALQQSTYEDFLKK